MNNAMPRNRLTARRARWAVAVTAVLFAAGAMAQKPLGTIEECLESGTELVRLPATPGGTINASECRGCASLRLSFDGRTRYYIGDSAVSYTRFREAAARDAVRLYVFYRPQDRTLTRLRLDAAGGAK